MNACQLKTAKPEDKAHEFIRHPNDTVVVVDAVTSIRSAMHKDEFNAKYKVITEDQDLAKPKKG